jgi:2,5-dioxopentanoate dehydrogenase
VNQLRLFADHIEEGSWVEARIDTPDPARSPLPRPDLRRMLIPLGPIVVFGASNFPLAFSVAGGDTASALAAGCPVVFKAHPAHPGTSELVARALLRAAEASGMPAGVFSLVHGWSHEVGLALVRHPLTRAVGFTGSLRGGRALFDAAASRAEPIPVYAEMGSINPVFLLPSALRERSAALAQGLAQSILLGAGQFCTNPGVILGVRGESLARFRAQLADRIQAAEPGVMLYEGIHTTYAAALERAQTKGAEIVAAAPEAASRGPCASRPTLLATDAVRFLADPELREEMFGPVSVLVGARDASELERVAQALEGQLTATVHGTEEELGNHSRLIHILQRKAGRLIFNGFPTGVEVGHAMHHGGPYPASTDPRTTSVGTAAITRFARPVCYQDFPDAALPAALRNRNVMGIWRLVDGKLTRADV